MGSTFAAVHVRSPDLDGIRRAIDGYLVAQDLVPAGEQAPDRVVAIVPGPTWTAVYDEAADIGDDAILDAIGALLSQQAVAFSVLLHDSDVLQLRLYQGGRKRALYDSNPGYFTGRRRQVRPDAHREAFAALLPPGGRPEALDPVFSGDRLFAEHALSALASALDADPARLSVGFRYQQEQGWPPGAVLLRYRDPRTSALPGGPPVIRVQAPAHCVPVAVGGQASVMLGLRNEGGPLDGFRVQVTGGEPVVSWRTLRVTTGGQGDMKVSEAPLVDGAAEVPVSIEGGPSLHDLAGKPPHVLIKAMTQGVFYLTALGSVDHAGTSTVRLSLTRRDGSPLVDQAVAFTGASTEGRPLRASPLLAPQQLAELDGDRWLTLLVCSTLPRHEAVDRLLPIVQALRPHLPTEGKVTRTIYPTAGSGLLGSLMSGMQNPKLWTGKAAGLWRGKAWTKLVETATTSQAQVELAWGEAEEGPGEATAMMALGSGIIPMPGAATGLALSFRHGDAELERALHEVVDTAVLQGGINQAVLTRTGSAGSLDHTAYELCCGISGQCTMGRRWVQRWLRGVGVGSLWVGPALQAHLDRAALPWQQVGDSWRLEVNDRTTVEAGLAPVLPSQDDWQRGMAERFAP